MKDGCPLCRSLVSHEPLTLIVELEQTAVFLNDQQGCEGWCVCVLREHVEHMDELSLQVQQQVFAEVARTARAIREVFPRGGVSEAPRINYECLGNVTPHIHWHVIPRHAADPTPNTTVWGWEPARLRGSMDGDRRRTLTEQLRTRFRAQP